MKTEREELHGKSINAFKQTWQKNIHDAKSKPSYKWEGTKNKAEQNGKTTIVKAKEIITRVKTWFN